MSTYRDREGIFITAERCDELMSDPAYFILASDDFPEFRMEIKTVWVGVNPRVDAGAQDIFTTTTTRNGVASIDYAQSEQEAFACHQRHTQIYRVRREAIEDGTPRVLADGAL